MNVQLHVPTGLEIQFMSIRLLSLCQVVCSPELKPDLCSKISDVVDRFAPSKRWQIDTLITTLSIAGGRVLHNK